MPGKRIDWNTNVQKDLQLKADSMNAVAIPAIFALALMKNTCLQQSKNKKIDIWIIYMTIIFLNHIK